MSTARYIAGATGKFTGTLKDADGTAIPNSNLLTLTLTLKDAATGATINSRSQQNVLGSAGGTGQNNVTVDGNGALTWSIQTADTSIHTTNTSSEDHVATFVWTFTSGSETKSGSATHFLHCVDYAPFCTFDDVKQQLPEISDQDQDFVEMLIESFFARAEQETGRSFMKQTSTTEVFSARPGQMSLRLSRYPISSVASIKQDSSGDFSGADSMDADNYEISSLGDEGIVRLRWIGLDGGAGTVQVVYVGGLIEKIESVNASTNVPWDLRMAAIRQVTYWYQRRSSLGLLSESIGGGSVSIKNEQDLLEDVRAVLGNYMPTTLG
jgi:hypothetical protein